MAAYVTPAAQVTHSTVPYIEGSLGYQFKEFNSKPNCMICRDVFVYVVNKDGSKWSPIIKETS